VSSHKILLYFRTNTSGYNVITAPELYSLLEKLSKYRMFCSPTLS